MGNPTCVLLRRADIVTILESSYKGIVVVDEAYVDFAGEGASVCDLIAKYPNLVVLQTMSKAFGLAGIRCSYSPILILLSNPKCKAFIGCAAGFDYAKSIMSIGVLFSFKV